MATVLTFSRTLPIADPPDLRLPTAERRSLIRYPGGHVVRINREHLERVLAVKAALADADDRAMRRG